MTEITVSDEARPSFARSAPEPADRPTAGRARPPRPAGPVRSRRTAADAERLADVIVDFFI